MSAACVVCRKAPRHHYERCRDCWNTYRRDLRQRHKQGTFAVIKCSECGEPTGDNRANVRLCGLHTPIGKWKAYRASVEAQRRQEAVEWANPTKEETWLRKAELSLGKARGLLRRNRSGMPSAASPQHGTSRG